jgi:hypothetical protein
VRSGWAARAVELAGDHLLADSLRDIEFIMDPETATYAAGRLREEMQDGARDLIARGQNPVAPLLDEALAVFDAASRLSGQSFAQPDPSLAIAARAAGRAMVAAFRIGVFNGIPPEARSVAQMLDRVS